MLSEIMATGAIVLTTIMPCSAGVANTTQAEFYVATDGNDSWSGKLAESNVDGTDGPFVTLERARIAVREAKSSGETKAITVMVRGGIYTITESFRLEAQDSGTKDAPVTYRAYPGDKVILRGGLTVPPDAFGAVTDQDILKRLPASAHKHVLQADLHALGITHLTPFPVKFKIAPTVPEVFFNNERMTIARWPDKEWATVAKIIACGSIPRNGDKGTDGGVFEYSGDRPSGWDVDAGVWLHGYWAFDWYDETIRIKSIDVAKRQITFAAPHVYGVRQGNVAPRRYYAMNLMEELDQPGEYFIDTKTGRLYFWPPAPLSDAQIVLSDLDAPVISIKDASNVILRGFTVEASLGDGIEVTGGSEVRIQACEVHNTRQIGIVIDGGTHHTVEACDIHDTGTGAITLAGGDRKTLTPAGHEAVNNHIWRFSRLKLTYSNALLIRGVGNRAAHNLIHDAPHQAIAIQGNDCIVEYNTVHHVCMECDDCGAFYKGRNPSCRGNIIRYNFWHHIGAPLGYGNSAIYFDDGDGGDTVFGNIFYRCGDPGHGQFGTVYSHGGHDNMVENNIFVECKRALGSVPWADERWKAGIDGGKGLEWQKKLLEEVDITKPPYITRYASLAGFMDPKPEQPRNNHAIRNVFVNCDEVSNGNWQVPADQNWVTDQDPDFIDAANGDFQLKLAAEVYSHIPDFEPIPFECIGLVESELRPTVIRQRWSDSANATGK